MCRCHFSYCKPAASFLVRPAMLNSGALYRWRFNRSQWNRPWVVDWVNNSRWSVVAGENDDVSPVDRREERTRRVAAADQSTLRPHHLVQSNTTQTDQLLFLYLSPVWSASLRNKIACASCRTQPLLVTLRCIGLPYASANRCDFGHHYSSLLSLSLSWHE